MSDDFDKEAEREKLREKYERDQQKREATEQMSELLLKGATMTNAHCSECGDPIFRYDGQEFCPTCEKPVNRDTGEEGDDEADDEDQIQVTTPSDDARVAFGDESADNGSDEPAARQTDTQQPSQAGAANPQQPQDHSDRQPSQAQNPSLPTNRKRELPDVQQPTAADSASSGGASGAPGAADAPARSDASVTAARESLVATLTRFSRLAEQTEDPRQAQEYLAAAREAAETLAELRR